MSLSRSLRAVCFISSGRTLVLSPEQIGLSLTDRFALLSHTSFIHSRTSPTLAHVHTRTHITSPQSLALQLWMFSRMSRSLRPRTGEILELAESLGSGHRQGSRNHVSRRGRD